MVDPIRPIAPIPLPEPTLAAGPARGPDRFRDVLAAAVQRVEQYDQTATSSVRRFLDGESEELHTSVLATQRAEMAFDLFLQTRNKVVAAYQEIMRMQM
jgi:flagellar hook-basal body complex protein FliE